MAFDMVKFQKGQIWEIYFRDKNERVPKGHEQQKDRPWIVLSTGKFNQSSGMITAAPLTSRDSIRTPAQVLIHDTRSNGSTSVIMCEQIRAFDCKSDQYIFEYVGTVSDEVLDLVDNALSIHLGLKFAPATLDRLYKSIDSMIRNLELTKSKISEPKFSDDDILKFAEMLEALIPEQEEDPAKVHTISDIIDEPKKEEPKVVGITLDDESSLTTDSGKISTMKDKTDTVKSKSPRMKWTKDVCKEFIDDMSTLPMKEVMTKWNIEKKARVYSMKNYAQSILDSQK